MGDPLFEYSKFDLEDGPTVNHVQADEFGIQEDVGIYGKLRDYDLCQRFDLPDET